MKKSWLKNQNETPAPALGPIGLGAAATGLALAGMVILWLTTRWGIGLYSDSIVYLGAARVILEGEGFSFLNDAGVIAPVVQYPPLYSATIATLSPMGFDPLVGARVFSVLCYGANALLVAYIAYRATSSPVAALLASFLALIAFPMVYIHSQALTEPMFIFMIFLGFCFLANYLSGSRPGMLYGCAACVGLSCLARYVGLAFIMTGAVAILCLSKANWQKKFTDAIKFSILSTLPLALWVLRNYFLARNPVNRTFGFHPPSLRDFLPATDTISHWLIPITIVEAFPWVAPFTVALIFVLFGWLATKANCFSNSYAKLLLFCVSGYTLFLLVSWSFNDQPLELDTRTLALPYLTLMILTLCLVTERLRRLSMPEKSRRRFAIHCLLIVVLAVQAVNGVVWLRFSYDNGIGFAIEKWRNSELLEFVKNTANPVVVFSNAPDFIHTLTGRRAFLIPPKIDRTSKQINPRYADQTAAMHDELRRPNAVLIYFDDDKRLWYLPSIHELEAKFPLQVIKQAKDGAIYRLNGHAAAFAP
jgi:4-amino-4-deoxy-L-arabinose transferase-like glycosyltransferase